jgi:hypothetical protein
MVAHEQVVFYLKNVYYANFQFLKGGENNTIIPHILTTYLQQLSESCHICFDYHFSIFFYFSKSKSTSLVILFIYLFYFLLFYYSYVHTRLGSFLPPAPTPSLTTHSAPSLSPLPPQYPAETILPYF